MIPAAILIVIMIYRMGSMTIDAIRPLETEVTARSDTHAVVERDFCSKLMVRRG